MFIITSSSPLSSSSKTSTIIEQVQSIFIWLVAVIRTIHVITDGHKSSKNWKLVFPNAKGLWGSEKLSNWHMIIKLIWSLSDICGERGRAAWGMILMAFSGYLATKQLGPVVLLTSVGETKHDANFSGSLLMSSTHTVPSIHLAWITGSQHASHLDSKFPRHRICSLPVKFPSHLLTAIGWKMATQRYLQVLIPKHCKSYFMRKINSLQMWLYQGSWDRRLSWIIGMTLHPISGVHVREAETHIGEDSERL